MKFTELEKRVLRAAQDSSDGNGHDFGFTEDIIASLPDLTPQQIGGVLSSLVKKGVFDDPPIGCDVNGVETVHQFVLNKDFFS